jgi:hypothetical protein
MGLSSANPIFGTAFRSLTFTKRLWKFERHEYSGCDFRKSSGFDIFMWLGERIFSQASMMTSPK